MNYIYKSTSSKQTFLYGYKLAKLITQPIQIGLIGDLGNGKTVFVKGFAQGLGVDKSIIVTSPTYNLMQKYNGAKYSLEHWDLYRLNKNEDIEYLEVFSKKTGDIITIIEWPDMYLEYFTNPHIIIKFEYCSLRCRTLEVSSYGLGLDNII